MVAYQPKAGEPVMLTTKAPSDTVIYGIAVDELRDDEWYSVQIGGVNAGLGDFYGFKTDVWNIHPWHKPVKFNTFAVVKLFPGWEKVVWPEEYYGLPPRPEEYLVRNGDGYWEDGKIQYELADDQINAALVANLGEILFEGVADAKS